MKIKDYIKQLQAIAKLYPKAIVIYTSNDYGAGAKEAMLGPIEGYFKDGRFTSRVGQLAGWNVEREVNCVCLN